MEYQYNPKSNTVEVACTRFEKLVCFWFCSERAIAKDLIRDLAPHDPQARAAKDPRVVFIHPPKKLERWPSKSRCHQSTSENKGHDADDQPEHANDDSPVPSPLVEGDQPLGQPGRPVDSELPKGRVPKVGKRVP